MRMLHRAYTTPSQTKASSLCDSQSVAPAYYVVVGLRPAWEVFGVSRMWVDRRTDARVYLYYLKKTNPDELYDGLR